MIFGKKSDLTTFSGIKCPLIMLFKWVQNLPTTWETSPLLTHTKQLTLPLQPPFIHIIMVLMCKNLLTDKKIQQLYMLL